jgi:ABC-type Fe3+/spermidine/putrescine transport system ATPase subunit
MVRVIFDNLVKRYGPVLAVEGASLEIRPGELACVLGPEGAGKTTLGRLLAGLETPEDGEVYLDDRMVQALPPHQRGIGVVFTDLALWPGLTVAEHVDYPLKVQGRTRAERRRRTAETMTLLRIDSLAARRPDQLSPPQALRVALARTLVTEPGFLILDDPLASFPERLRGEAWDEVRRIRGELGLATLLLTRSAADALAHADRLAVMDLGRFLQVGTPQDLYAQPADVFVARLLGPTNLLQGQVDGGGGEARREVVVRTPLVRLVARATLPGLAPGSSVTISIRPETLALGPTVPPDWNRFPATIERIIFRGGLRQLELRGPGDWPVTASALQGQSLGLREGQGVTLSVAPEFVTLLPGKFAVPAGTAT